MALRRAIFILDDGMSRGLQTLLTSEISGGHFKYI